MVQALGYAIAAEALAQVLDPTILVFFAPALPFFPGLR